MTNQKESAAQRLARMKQEQEAMRAKGSREEIVSQLTHESTGEPDYAELAEKLKQKQNVKYVPPAKERLVKITLYIEKDVADGYLALCPNHGDKQRFANEAFKDLIRKKAKELGL